MKPLAIAILTVTGSLAGFAETVITEGPAKVTIPERFVIERKLIGDEGGISGILRDTKTQQTIRFKIADAEEWQRLIIDPDKVDWRSVLHFERSPKGWFDQQFFAIEEADSIRIEARYVFQRCMFQSNVAKGADYRAELAALKAIKVELNDGWKVTRGKKFDEFEVRPTK